jgi:transcriptional regulator with XRE-family HTH domain
VRPHEGEDTTLCANGKHNLSLARQDVDWQLRRMSIGTRIKKAREAAGWSQGRIAKAVGKEQTTVSSWERGRTEPTREDVMRIADALCIPAATLELDELRPELTRPKVRLVGYVGAGAEAHFASADDPAEEVDAPEGSTVNTVAAEIRGASLGKAFDRWLVFYDDVRSPVTPDLHNQLCVVGTGDQVLVKILRPAGAPDRFHLISNADEEPLFDREVLWAAKVKNLKPR